MNATMQIVSGEIEFTQFVDFHAGDGVSAVERASLEAKSLCAVRLGEPCMRLLTALLPDEDDAPR